VQSNLFVNKLFRNYYNNEESCKGMALLMIEEREFGFISFDNIMIRHKTFANQNALWEFLKDFVPSDAYYSCAYYADPTAEMDRKGWIGADLIFDIDADHIPTSCDKVHDKWTCVACGFAGKGSVPSRCPICGKEKFVVNTWPCNLCLESAREETAKVLDMLVLDFGFSEKDIRVFFSGHRGYHVHVESELIHKLDAIARKEIVDYFTGLGLDMQFPVLAEKYQGRQSSPYVFQLGDFGWQKRLALELQSFIRNAKEKDFNEIGLKKTVSYAILKNKEMILKDWSETKALTSVKGVGVETWRKILNYVAKLKSAKIDTVVTADIHRLIRLPDTLHGKTGFKKVEFPLSRIDSFDPFKDAIAFREGEATVNVSDAPEFRVGDEVFGPYKNQKVELPTAAALLLVCKGRAEVVR